MVAQGTGGVALLLPFQSSVWLSQSRPPGEQRLRAKPVTSMSFTAVGR